MNAPLNARDVDAIVFDLGGVLIELDFDRAFSHWAKAGGGSLDRVREQFWAQPHQGYEIGAIDTAAFFAALRTSLALDVSDADLEEGWNAIFPEEVAGIRPILASLAERFPLYVFSNTNVCHQRAWSSRFAELLKPFHRVFTSCEMGKRKPAPEAFHAVAQAIEVPPERILFFDDTLVNVEGALAVGMQAVHVRSIADIEKTVQRLHAS
jgi:glucose-1-phosphatase